MDNKEPEKIEEVKDSEIKSHQRELLKALHEKDPLLADMYLGALKVLSEEHNSDRFALAAHGIREIMEKLPDYIDVKMKAMKESLKGKARDIESVWDNTKKNSTAFNGSAWIGDIDKHLRNGLKRIDSFFEWFKLHHPRRKAEIGKALQNLDPSAHELPDPLKKYNIDYWDEIRDYFVGVAHHRIQTDHKDFLKWVNAIEKFLLDKLQPRTFADQDEIDKLIQGKNSD